MSYGGSGAINVGSLYADLDVNTGNLEKGLARWVEQASTAQAWWWRPSPTPRGLSSWCGSES
jgi:hypothetical protein